MNTAVKSEPRYKIGQKYIPAGRHGKECTVIDILKTYNSKNELVTVRYISTHEYLGQTIINYDVCDSTIFRGAL